MHQAFKARIVKNPFCLCHLNSSFRFGGYPVVILFYPFVLL
jgi:hypothetical protein